MNTRPPNGYRRIYPNAPSDSNTHSQPPNVSEHAHQSSRMQDHDDQRHSAGGDASRKRQFATGQNSAQSTESLPALRLTNPYDSSSGSGAGGYSSGGDSRHVHFHYYHAYFLPPSPTQPQPQIPASIRRTFDERRTRYGCTPTCLVVSALVIGGVIALLVVAMGLALVGQMLTLPSSVPSIPPTPPLSTPTTASDVAQLPAIAVLPRHL